MTQVNTDNVLAVHRAFRDHANELLTYLQEARGDIGIGLCGLDPVSREVLKPESLAGKAQSLFEAHWRHWEELDAVASRLIDTARTYGRTEDEIKREIDETSLAR
ncbi:hypothetical protein EV378_4740 [Pseudonocardia endophytica]|uniref:Excreted virulence factor EspC (Type VII ESX diderm) n=2 Tax=Pseudonocardia endophytica TaxID=401976 RepID=A0A4R1HF68_PSEEN|nr:hypothetical protein EV378_4740 [Pseudonocardia endophytica]